MRVLENRVLRRILGPKRNEMTVAGENCIMRSFTTCILRQIFFLLERPNLFAIYNK
jgi:hypothetical protein